MILSDVELMARQDLFDTQGATERWTTSDLDRAIDKAVDRYSQYYPNINWVDMAGEPFQRTYPYPTPANPLYPVWWIERVLAPLQVYGSWFPVPLAGMTATAVAGAGLGTGAYQYAVTFISQGGETPPSPVANVTTSGGNLKVNLANIPQGPPNTVSPVTATNQVIGRNIYRSQVGGSVLNLLATIRDNTTQTFSDTTPDTSIMSNPTPPTLNTSGVMFWPPFERDFSEYSNIWDSSISLAAGGNMGAMGVVGSSQSNIGANQQSFTLKLNSAELPQDATTIMRVFYATKHQLDSSGSTIPEVHRDIIVLGAAAYAMEAYQVPSNDNFHFQDGALRDMVDDTNIPASWLASAKNKMDQFVARLEEIKQQRDFATSARVHWGDIPARWPRL